MKDAYSRQGELPARPAAQRTPCNLAGASEVIFALTWALGYRWAPRLADLSDLRLWRIDRHAHYGPLDGLARNHINTRLIAEHWDEICRLTASLRRHRRPLGDPAHPQRRPAPSSLARALAEPGRVIKTLHVLEYVHDPAYRRTIHHMLSRGRPGGRAARCYGSRAGVGTAGEGVFTWLLRNLRPAKR